MLELMMGLGKNLFLYGPGPKAIIAGNEEAGYFGITHQNDLFTEPELSSMVNVGYGIASQDPTQWLKFIYKGTVLYVARKPLRSSVAYSSLYASGLVYGKEGEGIHHPYTTTPRDQFTVVHKDSYSFLIRLLTGSDQDPDNQPGGEWNDLLLKLLDGTWGNHTLASMGLNGGSGSLTLCQNTDNDVFTRSVARGGSSSDGLSLVPKTSSSSAYGWRPVLELRRDLPTLRSPSIDAVEIESLTTPHLSIGVVEVDHLYPPGITEHILYL